MAIQILSTSPSPTLLSPKSTRFSYLPPPPTHLQSLRLNFRQRPSLAVASCSSQVARGVVELVADTQSSPSTSLSLSRTFLDARSGEELLSGIQREMEAGKLPVNVARGMEELYQNYKDAVLQSGDPEADEIVVSNMAIVLNRIFMVVKDAFVFSPYHKAIREPFDYYMFAQDYIRPLINFGDSYVGNISLFNQMEENLRQVGFCNIIKKEKDRINHIWVGESTENSDYSLTYEHKRYIHLKDAAVASQKWAELSSLTIEKLKQKVFSIVGKRT